MNSVRQILSFLSLASLVSAQSVAWQQVGGSFQAAPTLKGIVGQGYETPVITSSDAVVQSGFLAHPLFLNQGPFVASPLPDQSMALEDSALVLSIHGVFASWEGNALSYTVKSGAAVQVSITDSLLRISPVAGGSTAVIVTATDGTLSVSDTLEVSVSGGNTGIDSRPQAFLRSTELSARIAHPFAQVASGLGQGLLDAGLLGCTDNSCLTLTLSLPSASTVRISIFDQLGTPVISWNRAFTAQDLARIGAGTDGFPVTVSWNLRASNGMSVRPGVYLWKVEAQTADGQKLETVKRMGVK